MPEVEDLRGLVPQIQQPPLEAIVSTARRRRRGALAATLALGTAAFAAGGMLVAADDDRAQPPAGPVSPDEEVVRAKETDLVAAAVSPGDLDVRISLWVRGCSECSGVDREPVRGPALALTEDGFGAATFLAPPIEVTAPPVEWLGESSTRGPRIDAPAEGTFLLVDTEMPREWLVGADGSVARVTRVGTMIAPDDPKLWFKCHPVRDPGSWADVVPPVDPVHMFPWCALDLATATSYEWQTAWNGSVALPVEGVSPWGVDNRWQPTVAWWETNGVRHRQVLEDCPCVGRGVVWGAPQPTYYVFETRVNELQLLGPGPDVDLEAVRREPPGGDLVRINAMVATPGGALLAVQTFPEARIWRADHLTEGEFTLVHRSRPDAPSQLALPHEPVVADDHIDVQTPWGWLRSLDDGRTWTEVTTWR